MDLQIFFEALWIAVKNYLFVIPLALLFILSRSLRVAPAKFKEEEPEKYKEFVLAYRDMKKFVRRLFTAHRRQFHEADRPKKNRHKSSKKRKR